MIKCSRCGRKNKDGVKVCRKCGASLNNAFMAEEGGVSQSVVSNTDVALIADTSCECCKSAKESRISALKEKIKQKKLGKKGKLLAAAIAILALIALAILILAAAKTFGLYLPGADSYTVLEHNGNVNVVYKGKAALPHVVPVTAKCSADASAAGIIDSKGMLYSCRGGKSRTVDANASDLAVSDNGKYLLYTDSAMRLWAFNCARNDSLPLCICSEAVKPGYAVSCDGKWVLYNKLSGEGLYLCGTSNGKELFLGDGYEPVSVSNGAQYIYAYNKEDCSLYLLNKNGNSIFIRGGIGGEIWLNYDHTEVVFTSEASNGNIKTLLNKKGVEYEIAAARVSPAMTASMRPTHMQTESCAVTVCPWKSFDRRIFYGDGLYSFGYKGSSALSSAFDIVNKADPAELGITYAVLSDDMKDLYFTLNGGLYHSVKTDYANCEKLFADCAELACSANGNTVWFLDSARALYCCTGTKVTLVHGDVESFAASSNGREALFASNGMAYYCRSGSPSNPKSLGCSAFGVAIDRHGMYLYDGGAWYSVNNKGKTADLNDDR